MRVLESAGGDGPQAGGGNEGNGMGAAIYAGPAAAGILFIIEIIVIIFLWRRRNPSSAGMMKCFLITQQHIDIPIDVNIRSPVVSW